MRSKRPNFVVVARDNAAPRLDPALDELLAACTEPIARRELLCDILRIRSSFGQDQAA